MRKLRFKGDIHREKRKEKAELKNSKKEAYVPLWKTAYSAGDISGPLVLLRKGFCVSSDEENTLFMKPISKKEPEDVYEVFVGICFPSGKFGLKNANNKFLGSDENGKLFLSREALGLQEEWTLYSEEGGFAFQNFYQKYLSCNEEHILAAGSSKVLKNEIFEVRIQTGRREKLKEKDNTEFESNSGRMGTKRTMPVDRMTFSTEEEKQLKKAKKSGRIREALLLHRSKLKNDKFCK